ncbi:helix-turn-helix transcriptional regulator [Streptomyces inhibens]|uniref:helix-turn-helix transcriptional regulator n=1 Tax=Streptomyces inhibens TaxID=2293571 RepID=UPI0036828AFC
MPGLRGQELAQPAGVSVAYYIRREQGRGRNVSAAVLDAIGNALRLTPAERDHLRQLARPVSRRVRPAARPQRVSPALQQLIDTMENIPAYVVGRRLDIIGWNRLGSALLGDLAALPAERRNPDDPEMVSLISQLSLKSPEFRQLWAAHDVQDKGSGVKVVDHPPAGRLTLAYETLPAARGPRPAGDHLPRRTGAPSAEALRLLASGQEKTTERSFSRSEP